MKQQTLRAARERRKLTQKDLATASGVDQSVISRLEAFSHTNPTNATVMKLEKALQLRRGTLRFTPTSEEEQAAAS
jgi:transcriptional regulator with XRE-family HTH domain